MKKILSLIILCCFIVTGCQKGKESGSFDKYMKEGKEAVASEEYKQAMKFFQLAKEEKKDDAEANALYNQSNNLVEAIKCKKDKNYDFAIQLCNVVEKTNSESNAVKEAAKSLKDECDTLIKKEAQKAEKEEVDIGKKQTKSNNEKSNSDMHDSTPKYYYLDELKDIETKYDNVGYDLSIDEQAYSDWDNALNQIWATLKNQLPVGVMHNLTVEQKFWIKQKEAKANALSIDERINYLVEATKERCYYLVNNYVE
ncbi:lysozyme inhibitor LprI family protein [Terrisporobacter sp.]